jgi:hypothetical protein
MLKRLIRISSLALAAALRAAEPAAMVTIAPAPVERAALVVKVPMPSSDLASDLKGLGAFDADGRAYALQEDASRHFILVLGFVPANRSVSLELRHAEAKDAVHGDSHGEDGLTISIRGKEQLNFRMDKTRKPRADISPDILRAGYLHPVRSPSGAVVTGDYPSNHPHHHGIWTPYTQAIFQGRATDFWNMQNKKGRVDLDHASFLPTSKPGSGHPVFEQLAATLTMTDLTGPAPIPTLHDHWTVRLYDVPSGPKPMVVFDLTTTQVCAGKDALELPEYHYGSFGLRGPDAWNGKEGARFLTSEGITDRKIGDGTRARWCYLGGKTSAGLSGTAVLGFPDNFRFPMPLRLHPDMPYFSIVPQKLGAFSIQPGKPYVTRYRCIVTDGEPDAKLFDACWNSLAHPAVVRVTK